MNAPRILRWLRRSASVALILVTSARIAGADASTLTLEEAIRQALGASPAGVAAAARTDAADATVAQAGRFANPSLMLQAENLTVGGWPTGADPKPDVFALLSQPIELGGDRAARRKGALAGFEEADAERHRVEREIALGTARRYLAALRARWLGEILDANRAELETLAETQRRRVADGAAPEGDLMKLRAELARLDLQRARARIDLDENLRGLAVMLDVDKVISEQLVAPAALQQPPAPQIEPLEAAAARPEISRAQASLEAARHQIALERARRIPDVDVLAGYKRTGGLDTLVVGVSIPLPVFDRNADNIERAVAEERAAAADLREIEARIRAQTESLAARARELSQRARGVDSDLLEPARVARDAARAAFREGAQPVLQLVDAERTFTDVMRDALDLRIEAFAATFEIQWSFQEVVP